MLLLYWLSLYVFFFSCRCMMNRFHCVNRTEYNKKNLHHEQKNCVSNNFKFVDMIHSLSTGEKKSQQQFTWNWISIHMLTEVCAKSITNTIIHGESLYMCCFASFFSRCYFRISHCLRTLNLVHSRINWFWFSHSPSFLLVCRLFALFFYALLLILCQTRTRLVFWHPIESDK